MQVDSGTEKFRLSSRKMAISLMSTIFIATISLCTIWFLFRNLLHILPLFWCHFIGLSLGLTLSFIFIWNEQNEILKIFAKMITETHKAQNSLKESEKCLRDIMYASEDAILLISDNKFVDCNDAAVKMLEYPNKKMLLDTHPSELSPEYQPDGKDSFSKANEMIKQSLQKGYNQFNWDHKKADGTIVSIKVALTPIIIHGEMIIHCHWYDLTDINKVKEILQKNHNQFEELISNVPELLFQFIMKTDGTFCVPFATKNMVNYFGCSPEDVLSDSTIITNVIHIEDRGTVMDSIKYSAEHLSPLKIEYRVTIPDNPTTWMFSHSIPKKLEDGSVLWSGFNNNITDRKKTESELIDLKEKAESSNLTKSQFLMNMSHELRTPLNGIIGFAQILMSSDISEEQLNQVNVIQQCGENLLNLIEDILKISKINAEKLMPEKIPFNLQNILFEISALMLEKCKLQGIDYIVDYSSNMPKDFIGDGKIVKQILTNLISNAVKFTSSGYVKVIVKPGITNSNSLECTTEVIDTGIGIPPDKISKIDEEFYQVDGSITRKFGGTGLGLTISKNLVILLGGNISITSEYGKGSIFTFTIPLEIGKEQFVKKTTANLNLKYKERILIVEDDQINKKLIEYILQQYGFKVIDSVSNGKEAIEIYCKNEYDLILMDCQMAVMDGYEATKKIREMEKGTAKHIPIIALTAHAGKESRERCFNSGMDDYISKPLKIKNLAEKIDRYLDNDM